MLFFKDDYLFDHYRHTLAELVKQKGLLGLTSCKSQNKFQAPAKPRRLIVDLIDKETWVSMSADVKGDGVYVEQLTYRLFLKMTDRWGCYVK